MTARKRWDGRRLHFVGAGGCGMSGLALAAHALGASVTGSDRSDGAFLPRLRDRGISVTLGHSAGALPDGAEVVYSSAIPVDNPERAGASERGLREIGRGQLLAELVQTRRCVAVAGSHGKTTTAAMIVHALSGAGRPVDYVIGGDLLTTGINADWRDRAWCVVETDESDRSLLELAPEIAVLTNVEHEHVETFPAATDVEEVFRAFLGQSEHAVVWDRPQVRTLRDGPVSTFDAPGALLTPQGSQFSWRARTVRLRVPGAHNARNAAAALEACVSAGADPDASAAALADFPGVARRFEHIGHTASGAEIYDDYAHHPSEVMAALAAARTLEPDRLVAVLRPWGLARTQAMAHAYGVALARADLVVVLDVACEGKQPVISSGVGPRLIVDAAIAAAPLRPTRWISGLDAVERFLHEELDPEAMCVTLGCADVAQRLLCSPISTPDR